MGTTKPGNKTGKKTAPIATPQGPRLGTVCIFNALNDADFGTGTYAAIVCGLPDDGTLNLQVLQNDSHGILFKGNVPQATKNEPTGSTWQYCI